MLRHTITLALLSVGYTLPTGPPELTVTLPSMSDGNSTQLQINYSARHERKHAKGVQSANDLSSPNQEKDHGKSAVLPKKLGEQPVSAQKEQPRPPSIEALVVRAKDVSKATNSKITDWRMKINGIWYNRRDSMKAELGRFGPYRPNTILGQPGRYDLQSWAPIYWTATPPPTSTQNPYWSPRVLFSANNISGNGNIVTGDTIVIDTNTAHDLTMHANMTLGADAGNSLGAFSDDSIGVTVNSGLQMENEFTAGYALQQFYFKDEGVIVDWFNDGDIGNRWDAVQRGRLKAQGNAARIVTTIWLLVGVNDQYETSSYCIKGELSISVPKGDGGISGEHCDINNVLFNGDTIMAYQMSSVDWDSDGRAVGLYSRAPGY
jgi:hypothetical protein